jgi:hypothetical protein
VVGGPGGDYLLLRAIAKRGMYPQTNLILSGHHKPPFGRSDSDRDTILVSHRMISTASEHEVHNETTHTWRFADVSAPSCGILPQSLF